MCRDNEELARRMEGWLKGLEAELPEWEALPALELYMDQVIILLTQYLQPLYRSEDEKSITASIINNYVRLRLMPPPVKKKYSRVHIAYLIVICVLKQSLSISCIRQLLPEDSGEDAARRMYTGFLEQYRTAAACMRGILVERDIPADNTLVTATAIFSTLFKGLNSALLQGDEAPPVPAKKQKGKEG